MHFDAIKNRIFAQNLYKKQNKKSCTNIEKYNTNSKFELLNTDTTNSILLILIQNSSHFSFLAFNGIFAQKLQKKESIRYN